MLTSEEKDRIEKEEARRIAEERYRAQVRERLMAERTPPEPATPIRPNPESSSKRFSLTPVLVTLILAMGVVGVVMVADSYLGERAPGKDGKAPIPARAVSVPPPPKVRFVPVSQKLATGQVVIRPGAHIRYRIEITEDMNQPRIRGNFNASGGSGNDIAAVIATESEYTNWINGHGARVFWDTNGKKTTGAFDVRLPPGSYILAVSNQFSLFSSKYVFLEVDLNYTRKETY